MVEPGEWQDILSNGAVMKQIIRPSPITPPLCPEFKQHVIVHVVGRTIAAAEPSKIFQDTRAHNQPIHSFIGDQILDYLTPGLMLCVRTMSVGEIARVKLASRYAFANGGHWFGLAPNTDVEYEAELLTVGEMVKEVPEMTLDELKQTVAIYKNRGNEFFKWGEMEKALRCHKEGVRYGDGALQMKQEGGEQVANWSENDDEILKDRLACLNNIATVLEKQGKLKEAMESTVMVLEHDPRHLKSLVRAARVAVLQGSHEEAQAAVDAAVGIAPTSDAVIKVKKDLEERVAKNKALEKERWGGFLKPVPPEQAEKLRKQEAERLEKEKTEKAKAAVDELKNNTEVTSSSVEANEIEIEEDELDGMESETQAESIGKDSWLPIPELLELFARLVVLLSPTIVFLFSLLLWRVFAV
jgi:tetratricopeptide (TPR) repeat protein